MIKTIKQSFLRRAYNMKRSFLKYLEENNAKTHEQDVVDVLNRVFKNKRIPYIAKNEQELNKKNLLEINNYKCDFSIHKRGSKTLTWGEIKFSKKYRPFNLQFVIKNLSIDNFKSYLASVCALDVYHPQIRQQRMYQLFSLHHQPM